MITFVGFSPAWQQVYCLGDLVPGQVHRANCSFSYASGKATNAAIVATRYTKADVCLVTVIGEAFGELFARDVARHAMETRFIDAARTRVCTTIVADNGGGTELIENAPAAKPQATELAIDAVRALQPTAIACCGSLPPGVSPDVYMQVVALSNGPTIVDATGNPLLKSLPAQPTLVKPNREELVRSTGVNLTPDDPADGVKAVSAMQSLLDRGAQNVLVTNGAEPAVLMSRHGVELFPVPRVDHVVNTIGAGDSLTGAMLAALVAGHSLEDAVSTGLNAGSLKCTVLKPEDVPQQQTM